MLQVLCKKHYVPFIYARKLLEKDVAVNWTIFIYGCWKEIDTKSHIFTLGKVDRLFCIAIKSTPQLSLEIMLHILFPNIFKKNIAAKSAVRLKEFGELKHDYVGHSTFLRGMASSLLVQRPIAYGQKLLGFI